MENSHQHTICLCNVYTPTLPSLRHPSNFLYISCVELHLCFQGHWEDVVPKCILSLLSSTLPLQSKLPLKLPVPKPSPSDLVGVHPAPQEFKVFRIGRLAVGGTSHWKMGLIFFFSRLIVPYLLGRDRCPRNLIFGMWTQRSNHELILFVIGFYLSWVLG